MSALQIGDARVSHESARRATPERRAPGPYISSSWALANTLAAISQERMGAVTSEMTWISITIINQSASAGAIGVFFVPILAHLAIGGQLPLIHSLALGHRRPRPGSSSLFTACLCLAHIAKDFSRLQINVSAAHGASWPKTVLMPPHFSRCFARAAACISGTKAKGARSHPLYTILTAVVQLARIACQTSNSPQTLEAANYQSACSFIRTSEIASGQLSLAFAHYLEFWPNWNQCTVKIWNREYNTKSLMF